MYPELLEEGGSEPVGEGVTFQVKVGWMVVQTMLTLRLQSLMLI